MGAEFLPVCFNKSASAESKDWFQLGISNACCEIVPPTRVGIDPFNDEAKGEFRCPFGDLIGLNMLSEVFVKKTSCREVDITFTRQFVGIRQGLLRPERIILVSQKVAQAIISENLKGVEFEVSHLL